MKRTWLLVAVLSLVLFSHAAMANNISVTNVVLYNTVPEDGTTEVKFDLSWENSWRASWTENGATPPVAVSNWDAAWVFVKYRDAGGDWQHATLASTQPAAPAGTAIDMGATDGTNVGAFVYRSTSGSGAMNLSDVKLRWDYDADGVLQTEQIDVAVYAIEMVYVAEGSYELGSGGAEGGHFYKDPTVTDTYTVSNENAITVGTTDGNLYYIAGVDGDYAGTIPTAFPNGYSAFYCMKYEISQGQYADFLNQQTLTVAEDRDLDESANRQTITQGAQPYSASAPDRACNWLSWADGTAYADWSGLRPMTELEYEKACRGPLPGVANEQVWGTTAYTTTSGIVNDGTGTATATGGNVNYSGCPLEGPYRCGIYATASSTREQAGATYWGIMNMGGNLRERAVTIGNSTGRAFMGTHGDGELGGAYDRDATNPDWPTGSGLGAGLRGGSWTHSIDVLTISNRGNAVYTSSARKSYAGCRAVRSAQ